MSPIGVLNPSFKEPFQSSPNKSDARLSLHLTLQYSVCLQDELRGNAMGMRFSRCILHYAVEKCDLITP